MAKLTVEIDFPDDLQQGDRESTAREYFASAVAKWYELGLVSQSRGAELLGLNREEFLSILNHYGVAAIQADPDSFASEFAP